MIIVIDGGISTFRKNMVCLQFPIQEVYFGGLLHFNFHCGFNAS